MASSKTDPTSTSQSTSQYICEHTHTLRTHKYKVSHQLFASIAVERTKPQAASELKWIWQCLNKNLIQRNKQQAAGCPGTVPTFGLLKRSQYLAELAEAYYTYHFKDLKNVT